jgi:hypothetical protein
LHSLCIEYVRNIAFDCGHTPIYGLISQSQKGIWTEASRLRFSSITITTLLLTTTPYDITYSHTTGGA